MKARMLVLTILCSCSGLAHAKSVDFGSEIAQAEAQSKKAEKSAFYDNSWLRLRQRKRFSIAKNEAEFTIRLRPATSSSSRLHK